MGEKGDKLTSNAVTAATDFVAKLDDLGNIKSKKMFGGHGVFFENKMFGIVDSKGICFLKVDENLKASRLKEDAKPHSKMPYVSIPEPIFKNQRILCEWARQSIEIALK